MPQRIQPIFQFARQCLSHLLCQGWSTLRTLWRILRLCEHVLRGLYLVYFVLLRCDPKQRANKVQRWNQRLLRVVGVRLELVGEPYAQDLGPVLWVGNHISWLDVPALQACVFSRFIAKYEIQDWPVVGRMARAVDTLFLQRGVKSQTQQVLQQVGASLRNADRITVFPEGTTSHGDSILPFGRRFPAVALSVGCPIQVFAITYLDGQGRHTAVPGWGQDSFMCVFWRSLSLPELTVRVEFAPAYFPAPHTAPLDVATALRDKAMQMRAPFLTP